MNPQIKIFISAGLPNVSPKDAFRLCQNGATIIDIRDEYITSYKQFGVIRVIYCLPGKISLLIHNLDKYRTYIVAETSKSVRSREIVKLLSSEGFAEVYNLAGGFVEWERDGLPVNINKNQRLSGSCMCMLKPREKNRK